MVVYKWIRRYGTKMVLFRMMLVALGGYFFLTFMPGSKGDELDMLMLFGVLEVPGQA